MNVPPLFTAAFTGVDPASLPTTTKAGDNFFYSAGQWQFLAAIIEAKTELTYKEAIKKYISDKLDISSPAFEPLQAHSDPGGGIFGTAEAFGKVLGAYLSGSLLNKSTTDIMETPWTHKWNSKTVGITEHTTHKSAESTYVGYALGMWVDCDNSNCTNPAVYHSIGGRGFLPLFDRKNDYWAVLARASVPLAADMSNVGDVMPWGAGWSVPYFGTLAPMIDQLYVDGSGPFDTAQCDAACK
jgi:CubicO group peptidase (beta-lactamase class C family)